MHNRYHLANLPHSTPQNLTVFLVFCNEIYIDIEMMPVKPVL
jgi:hypothetical protein